MNLTWQASGTFISLVLGYIAILVVIGTSRPRVCIRLVEMLNTIITQVLIFAAGAAIALTWARSVISDPANHGHFWGPELGPTPEESLGNRRIVFAHDALAGEQGMLITAVIVLGLLWVIHASLIVLCRHVIADKALDGGSPQAADHTSRNQHVKADEDGSAAG